MSGPAGYKPCYKKWQRGGAAGPRRVVESHSQNQGPSGASREGVSQPVHSALCNADQVFQTGTTCRVDLHLIVAQYWFCQSGFIERQTSKRLVKMETLKLLLIYLLFAQKRLLTRYFWEKFASLIILIHKDRLRQTTVSLCWVGSRTLSCFTQKQF